MPDLLRGEVTFCFTDIEGSTRLARHLGDGWLPVLRRHNVILRDVWAASGGIEVSAEGDAFLVVFRDAGDAITAAIRAHRDLAAETWPEGSAVRIRIGLHSGTADIDDGNYVGVEVHKAARICSAARAGQVLTSGRTRELAAARLPGATRLVELGVFSLKGFEDGVDLFRVDHAELADARAPNALPVEAHNLPLLQTAFFGRDAERIEVAKLCEQPGLTTIVGTGGAGKTRLALEVGRAVAKDRADGVWAVLLAGEPVGGDVTAAVARGLAVGDVAGVSLVDAIVNALHERDTLVLLDNCEHVLASTAQIVSRLLERCPEVSVLATSRQPLGLPGERVWLMPPLLMPWRTDRPTTFADVLDSDAGRLFVDRATMANPAFALSDAIAPAVARVCEAVDGLPLAIELAAAASRSLPLDVLSERIASGVMPLRSTSVAPIARQRSVADLIGWSYDLLDEVQAAVFRRLSVFRGGWTIEAAEATCAGGVVGAGDVIIALSDLVDRSLVLFDGDARYRMLALVRGFAEQRVREAGEDEQVRDLHLAHFRQLAVATRPEDTSASSVAFVEAHLDNFRAALERAVALDDPAAAQDLLVFVDVLLNRSHYADSDALYVLVQSIARPGTPLSVEVLVNRSQLARALGDAERSCALAAEGLASAERLGDQKLVVWSASELAAGQFTRGDAEAALATVDAYITPDLRPTFRARLLAVRGIALLRLGNEAEGASALLEAADIEAGVGDELRAGQLRLWALETLYVTGRHADVLDILRAAVSLADAHQAGGARARAISTGAELARRAGGDHPLFAAEVAKAVNLPGALDDAVTTAEDLGEASLAAECRIERAWLRLAANDVESAVHDLRSVLGYVEVQPASELIPRALALTAIALAQSRDALAPTLARTALAGEKTGFEAPLRNIAAGSDQVLDMHEAARAAAQRLRSAVT